MLKSILALSALAAAFVSPTLHADNKELLSANPFTEIAGICPDAWSQDQVYVAGDMAIVNEDIYFAKWWVRGTHPTESGPGPHDGPWLKLDMSCEQKLARMVSAGGIWPHLEELNQIAIDNGGTRFAGTAGHEDSLAYIRSKLEGKYDISEHEFSFTSFQEVTPAEFSQLTPVATPYVSGEDFILASYSGSGHLNGNVVGVDLVLPPSIEPNGSTSGCEPSDFYGVDGKSLVTGSVALVQRGSCSFAAKAENAQDAGATGVIIFNEGQEGRTAAIGATLSDATYTNIPVVFASHQVGADLAAQDSAVYLKTDTLKINTVSRNLIAETATGNPNKVVMVGSHLDSVEEGPGINDNGSGSAAILDMALQLDRINSAPANKVRFAWWSAEESGLVGSIAYVNDLTQAQLDDIELYINFDMISSPNFARFVFGPEDSPMGSELITNTFKNYFDRKGVAYEFTYAGSRSDHAGFRATGIPIGGLFTGAEVIKTEEQALMYGGEAGVAFDKCYHAACDDLTNVNFEALNSMAKAGAHTLSVFAQTDVAVKDRPEPTFTARSVRAQANRVDLSNEDMLGKLYRR